MMHALRQIYEGWKVFTMAVGQVNNRIVLSVVFLVIFGPSRAIQMLLGKDFLDRRLDDRTTNWHPVEKRTRKVEEYLRRF
jgi:hypothetical protein